MAACRQAEPDSGGLDGLAGGRSASGMTTTALLGAGQTAAHTPQPVQTSSRIRGFPAITSIASGTGQRSEQTVQNEPVCARQAMVWIHATPIFNGRSALSTAGLHAVMQGVSAHMMHAEVFASIIGVPAASRNRSGASTIAETGQAVTHSLHRVQPARNETSSTAPGGRWIGSAKRRPMPRRVSVGVAASTRSTPLSATGFARKSRPRRRSRRDRLGSSLISHLNHRGAASMRPSGTSGRPKVGESWSNSAAGV